MKYFVYAIQMIGIIIPLTGIIALLRRKHQNNNSMFLMITNIGCLIMNSGYLLMMSANDAGQARLISNIEYAGNVLFYFFFVLFLVSYLWKKCPEWPFHLWAAFEGFGALLYWSDTLREEILPNLPFLAFEKSTTLGVYARYINQSVIYMVRYSLVSFLLFWLLIYSNIRLFRMKDRTARVNLARLIGAQFVIILSLAGYLIFEPAFDFVPILASLSILSIILSVINDEFYGITEMGHEWVFEQMNDAFIIVDKNYGYLDSNSYAANIFEKIGHLTKQVRIPDEIYDLFTDTEEIYQNGDKYYEKKIVEIEDKGSVAGYSMLLVDVTKRQELMERVQEEKDRADAANQAKSAFVSNVSHEIRTPMNAIVGMTQILLRKDLPKQERDYIVNIQNSGNALLTIINDILDMSKIESGKMELVEEDYDFMAMLNDLGMILLNRIGS